MAKLRRTPGRQHSCLSAGAQMWRAGNSWKRPEFKPRSLQIYPAICHFLCTMPYAFVWFRSFFFLRLKFRELNMRDWNLSAFKRPDILRHFRKPQPQDAPVDNGAATSSGKSVLLPLSSPCGQKRLEERTGFCVGWVTGFPLVGCGVGACCGC